MILIWWWVFSMFLTMLHLSSLLSSFFFKASLKKLEWVSGKMKEAYRQLLIFRIHSWLCSLLVVFYRFQILYCLLLFCLLYEASTFLHNLNIHKNFISQFLLSLVHEFKISHYPFPTLLIFHFKLIPSSISSLNAFWRNLESHHHLSTALVVDRKHWAWFHLFKTCFFKPGWDCPWLKFLFFCAWEHSKAQVLRLVSRFLRLNYDQRHHFCFRLYALRTSGLMLSKD